jgi:hypothetical protein
MDAHTTQRINKQVSLVFVNTPPSRPSERILQLLAAIRQLDDCRPRERFPSFSANANPLADHKGEVDVIWSVESGISPLPATSPIPRRSASAMCLASASRPTAARAAGYRRRRALSEISLRRPAPQWTSAPEGFQRAHQVGRCNNSWGDDFAPHLGRRCTLAAHSIKASRDRCNCLTVKHPGAA